MFERFQKRSGNPKNVPGVRGTYSQNPRNAPAVSGTSRIRGTCRETQETLLIPQTFNQSYEILEGFQERLGQTYTQALHANPAQTPNTQTMHANHAR